MGGDRAVAAAGAPWRDLPDRYGPRKTAHERLRLWTKGGTWDRILERVIVEHDAAGDRERIISIDSSVVRAPALRGCPEERGCSDGIEALGLDGEALGRSRGGLSTKIHLAVEGRGLPMRFLLAPGQAGDNPQLVPPLDGISVAGDGDSGQGVLARFGGGRPQTFDAEADNQRNVLERCFNRLNQFRDLATRYAKRAA